MPAFRDTKIFKKGDEDIKMKKGKKIALVASLLISIVASTIYFSLSNRISAEETMNTTDTTVLSNFDSGLLELGKSSVGTRSVDGDYANELTYSKWSNPDWGQESAANKVVYVSTYAQFNKALHGTFVASDGNDQDGVPYVQKNDANYVKLVADIDNPGNTAPVLGTINDITAAQQRDVVIDGNGYYLNTGGLYFRWGAGTLNNLTPIHVYLKNLTMYSQNPYGCFSIWFNRNSSIVYDNVNYTGSQLTASYQTTQVYRGKNTIRSVKEYKYTQPSGTEVTRSCYFSNVASGMEGRRVYVQSGSVTDFEAVEGDALILGAYTSNYITSNAPLLHLEKGAELKVKSTGNGGESYSYNATGSVGDAANIDNVVYAGANIQNGGSLTLAEGAKMTVDVTGTGRAGVRLTGGTATRRTTLQIGKSASLKVLTDGDMGVAQSGPFGGVNAINYPKYAGLSLEPYSDILLSEEGAVLDVDMKNDKYQFNATLGYSPGIRMNSNSNIYVASKSLFKLQIDGSYGSALKMIGANSQFLVEDEGEVSFNSKNQAAANSNMLQVDNGIFKIGRKGIFDMIVEDGSAARNMFYVGSGTFTFADAMRVDLDAQANDNVSIVTMNGTFNADIQAVYGWIKGNKAKDKADANHEWIPIYDAVVNYTGSNVTNVVANSVSTTTKTSFVNDYRTQNFNRVLYEWIPDVEVFVDEVSDNETIPSGQKITGVTNPLAMVTFYITRANSSTEEKLSGATLTNEVDDWAAQDEKKFHVKADADGNFSFDLPSDVTLYVGDTIRAHSFRNGKENSGSTVVVDRTAPEVVTKDYYAVVNDPAPVASDFVDSVTDKGVVPPKWNAAYNALTPDATIAGWMTAEGVYDVKLDVADEAMEPVWVQSKVVSRDQYGNPILDQNGDPVMIPAVDTDGNPIMEMVLDQNGDPVMQSAPNVNSVPWDAKLHILDAAQKITADDFTTNVATIKAFNTLDELKAYILQQSNAAAYKIENHAKVDLTSQIVVSNLRTLDLDSLDGTYQVDLSVPGEGLTTTITIIVEKSEDTITVKFLDEDDTELHAPILITGTIGQTIDLTNDTIPGISDVLAAIADVESQRYVIGTRPSNETAVPVVNGGTSEAIYRFKGVLALSAPDVIDFKTHTVAMKDTRVEEPELKKSDQSATDLVVFDNRASKKSWTLTATLTKEMTHTSDSTKILNNAIQFNNGSIEKALDGYSTVIKTHQHDGTGNYVVNNEWSSGGTGIKLEVPAGSVKKLGQYQAEITWHLGDTP